MTWRASLNKLRRDESLDEAEHLKIARRLALEYRAGASVHQLAVKYATSTGRVRRFLHEQGVELRGDDVDQTTGER